jgi:DNA-binding NtrC family response regulator
MLAEHFLDELNVTEGTNKRFSPPAISRLYDHPWPGNVRELKNYVQRAYIMADNVIDDSGRPDASPQADDDDDLLTVRIGTPLEEIERRVTMATLARCNNVKKRAAEVLGISLKTLYNRLEAYAQKDKAEAEQRQPEEAH